MPELSFNIKGVESAAKGLVPLLHFKLEVINGDPEEVIENVLLQAQIQIQPTQRCYVAEEKEKLADLFGTPERWGQTLRNQFWAHSQATVRRFTGSTEVILPVPCTYDLNVLGSKYFNALEGGDVSLLFLFSGSIFHHTDAGRLQVQQISWEKESSYRMPVTVWKEMMEHHYPNSAWLSLRRDVFDELAAYKRRHGLVTWEHVLQQLLANEQFAERSQRRNVSDEQAIKNLL
ncbi:MAG: hypothetical protein JWM16_772 [Verrucomicrobiales bacterium]|nr:hypothetical protein [Verrucomicrobiales bacterium]